jgi:hypothetical protein
LVCKDGGVQIIEAKSNLLKCVVAHGGHATRAM